MAFYKYVQFLLNSNDRAFQAIHKPGTVTPHSGIYRCEGCGHEIVCSEAAALPPQNHHPHHQGQGGIRWRLIVCTQTKETG